MNVEKHGKRKAISPVLATVILIAITLIAAIAIAGFVFGLFGTFTSSATISASAVSCTSSSAGITCTVQVTNSGNANGGITGASLKYASSSGSTNLPAVSSWSIVGPAITTAGTPLPVNAGSSDTVTLYFSGASPPVTGSSFTGTLTLSNGGSAQFSGSF